MNRKEFTEACAACGYANKKTVEAYARERDEFTDDDFVEVYRLNQWHCESGKWREIITDGGSRKARTTKHYITIGRDK